MMIPSNIQDEIKLYCEANNITDIDKFILKILRTGFNVEKYGMKPTTKDKTELKYVPLQKQVPIEKIEEVVKEEPIEEKNKDIYDED